MWWQAKALVVLGVMAVVVAPTHAFQETKAGGSAPSAAARAQEAPAGTNPGLDLQGTGTSIAPPSSSGLEVRIPGLGKLGVLPKLDFGLELLYGVNQAPAGDGQARPDESDDFRIRGSLKHRF